MFGELIPSDRFVEHRLERRQLQVNCPRLLARLGGVQPAFDDLGLLAGFFLLGRGPGHRADAAAVALPLVDEIVVVGLASEVDRHAYHPSFCCTTVPLWFSRKAD